MYPLPLSGALVLNASVQNRTDFSSFTPHASYGEETSLPLYLSPDGIGNCGVVFYVNPSTFEIRVAQDSACPETSSYHRRRPLRALFVNLGAEAVRSCQQELERAQFTVNSKIVRNLAFSMEQFPLPRCLLTIRGGHNNGSQYELTRYMLN